MYYYIYHAYPWSTHWFPSIHLKYCFSTRFDRFCFTLRLPPLHLKTFSRPLRRLLVWTALCAVLLFAGCVAATGTINSDTYVWSSKGLDDGRFIKPRAIAINESDQLFIVDKTSRIQVFDRDGKFIRSWRTPACVNGKPCGMSFSHDGLLMVADTHYFQVLFYTPEGEMVPERTIGGETGRGLGQFGFLTDVVQDSAGNYYVGEYGDFDRIQKFDSSGKPICQIGNHGEAPESFLRPQGLFVDAQDQLWVADSSNHRVQVFDLKKSPPEFVKTWGSEGSQPGQLRYPYTIEVDKEGFVYVCELGNHRIQKFTSDGDHVAMIGGPGRVAGQFHQPWAFATDSHGIMHVIDSYNHRVQRINQTW